MKCPECNEVITYVNCYSQCKQTALIQDDGKAYDYDSAEVIGGDSNYECPECSADLTHLIKD